MISRSGAMKMNIIRGLKISTILPLAGLIFFLMACSPEKKPPEEYVNPNIGGIGHLLVATSPDVTLPGGMVKIAPYTTPGITDKYLADKIYGFPLHKSSHRRYVVTALLMASCGKLKVQLAENASDFDHDFEISTPYYYQITLEKHDIKVEGTVTDHGLIYRLTFPKSEKSHILLSLAKEAHLETRDDFIIEGYEPAKRGRVYFHAEFSKPFPSFGTWNHDQIVPGPGQQSGDTIGAFASFNTRDQEQILVKIGLANKNMDQAIAHLEEEIPDWNFDAIVAKAKSTWHQSLNTLQVQGGSEEQRVKFYTALYRVGGGERLLQRMRLSSKDLLKRARTYAAKTREELVPSSHRQSVMFQHRYISLITDMYLRGIRDFDVEKAYANMKIEFMETTKIPWRKGPLTELDRFYLQNGFIPALSPDAKEWVREVDGFEKRQCVTITLQAAYESWCLAQLAKALGKDEDYALFIQHAMDYQNVFNPMTGFMAPKTADAKWIEPFDPTWSGGFGGRDYFAEMNSWTYTWYVPHDIQGLIRLMGGRGKFVEKLDALFVEQYGKSDAKGRFLGQFPDETGLIGQYAHGNEFSRHIPYLYNYAGAPWKTQKRVREIMDIWYGTGPLGICGDEDSGLMSLWYVYAAIGIQPASIICPNYPVWLISSPVFKKSTLALNNDKTFVIEAEQTSPQNKYIQSAVFNGTPWNKPWFEHVELEQGGSLVLTMGPKPNKRWGNAPEAAPPSLSQVIIGK